MEKVDGTGRDLPGDREGMARRLERLVGAGDGERARDDETDETDATGDPAIEPGDDAAAARQAADEELEMVADSEEGE